MRYSPIIATFLVSWLAAAGGHAAPINDLPPPIATRLSVFSSPFTVPVTSVVEQPAEVWLLTSGDRGATWQITDRVDLRAQRLPYKGGFTFRAATDGEYWFAIRTADERGQIKSAVNGPELRVVVNTRPPLDSSAARGSAVENRPPLAASINGSVPFANTPAGVGGAPIGRNTESDTRARPNANAGFSGATEWPADALTNLPLGRGASPRNDNSMRSPATNDVVGPLEGPALGPSSDGRIRPSGQALDRPGNEASNNSRQSRLPSDSPVQPPVGNRYLSPANERPSPEGSLPSHGNEATNATRRSETAGSPVFFDRGGTGTVRGSDISSPRMARASGFDYVLPPGEQLRMVNSTVFELDYDLESVGRSGVAKVELWMTRDGGRTWANMGVDSDNRSPFRTAVDGEGVFGYRITVQSGSGLGGRSPQSGDLPQVWIGVDLTRPAAQLVSAEAASGERAGEILIRYEANDALLAKGPITLLRSGQPGGPWTTIAAGLDSTGQYGWRFDNTVPDRVYLRLEVRDEAGNIGTFEAADPISLERVLPQGRLRDVRPVSDSAPPRASHDAGIVVVHAQR
jgi:hypothetical protein